MRFLAALLCAWPTLVWAGGNSGPNGGTSCAGFTDPNCAFLDVSQSFTKGQAVTPFALTDAATITVDASQSNEFTVTLGGNRTLANPTNLKAGQVLTFTVTQDGTGGRTLAFGGFYNWMAPPAPLLNTGATTKTTISCNADTTTTLQCAGGAPVTTISAANGLNSTMTTVAVNAATAPTSGQTLTASSSTAASWVTPTIGYQAYTFTTPLTTGVGASTLCCFMRVPRGYTVDNITATAVGTLVTVTPSLFECGTSTTCASPTTIGSGAITSANTATPITVSNGTITSGDYIALELTAGTITSVAVTLSVEMH